MNAIQNLAKRSLLLVALFVIGCLQLMAQTRTIKGEVTDAQNGEALIGATVMVEGERAVQLLILTVTSVFRYLLQPRRSRYLISVILIRYFLSQTI